MLSKSLKHLSGIHYDNLKKVHSFHRSFLFN